MKAKIHVTLKSGILDPQGKAIEHALETLGFKNVGNVRMGKYLEMDLQETTRDRAEAEVKAEQRSSSDSLGLNLNLSLNLP